MDYGQIKLGGERCDHLTKRLNRLTTWKFFKVLYGNSSFRILLINFLTIVCCAPIILFMYLNAAATMKLAAQMPLYGGFGVSAGVWTTIDTYYAQQVAALNHTAAWEMALGALLVSFVFSGVFAVVRDSFWIGSIKILKPFGMGVKANFPYAIVSAAFISATVYGLVEFFWWASVAMAKWLAIVLVVLLSVVAMFFVIYLLILCSVTVTYKQSVKQNLSDSWLLLWKFVLQNIVHFIIACIPIALYVFIGIGGGMGIIVLMLLIMIGFFFVPFVWQTYMMRIFAAYHPVVVNKKGEPKKASNQPQTAVAAE